MGRWQPAVGIACGIALWMLLSMRGNMPAPVPRPGGAILPECDGALSEVVVQYAPGASFARALYAQLLPQLPADVTVDVVCPDSAAYGELQDGLGAVSCRLHPIIAGHAMTTWSRDRWVALCDPSGAKTTLVAPAQEDGAENWPARDGDARVAFTIAAADPARFRAWRSPIFFDGGDLLADGDCVFATPAVALRNLQQTVQSREDLLQELERVTGRRAILLEGVPEHHAGMFMMSAGNRVMVVGDPSLARPIWEQQHLWPEGQSRDAWQPDFSPEMQAKFDAAARQAAAAGYRVVRIPTIPGIGTKAYLTYVNVLMDCRSSRRVVYLPVYRGLEAMNAAATAVWEGLGYEVHPIDCTDVFPHFGTLHCLVSVLRRIP